MVPAMPYIRDEQWDAEYRDHWNNNKPRQRAKLLQEAGYSTSNYMYRTWGFLTKAIRTDIVTIIKRQKEKDQAATPVEKPAGNKKFWWRED